MRRELAKWAEEAYELSQRRAARLIDMPRMTLRYEPHRDPQDALRARLRELTGIRVRYGYRRLTVLLEPFHSRCNPGAELIAPFLTGKDAHSETAWIPVTVKML